MIISGESVEDVNKNHKNNFEIFFYNLNFILQMITWAFVIGFLNVIFHAFLLNFRTIWKYFFKKLSKLFSSLKASSQRNSE